MVARRVSEGELLVGANWCFSLADASGFQKKKRRCAVCARSGAWAKPKLKSFVRLAPFLGAVAILVTNKKVPRRLTAQRRTGDSPPFDTAVIVPKCRSPNIWAAGQDSV